MIPNCRKVKRLLGTVDLDELPDWVIGHLEGCSGCRETHQRLHSFRRMLTETVDGVLEESPSAELPTPDSGGAQDDHSRRPLLGLLPSSLLKAAALAVLVGVVGLTGYRAYRSLQRRSFIRQDTTAFVEELFSEPLFGGSTDNHYYQSVAESVIDSSGLLSGVLVELGS